jgi:hypothetical protein
MRDVECEVRDSLVNGQIEVVRLDTFEVVDTYMPGASVDDDEPDPNQPALPFAAARGPGPALHRDRRGRRALRDHARAGGRHRSPGRLGEQAASA